MSPKVQAADDMSTKNKIKIKKKAAWQRSLPDDSEEYSLEKMEILGQKRQGLILDIKRFLRESTSEDQKSELNLRLGSLYMEDYYATLAKAQQVFEKQNAEYQKLSKDKKKSAKAPKFDNSDALASLDKARSIYRDLIQRYPKHPRIDEMHYFMAMASMDRGKVEDGMAYFKLLSERSPKSRYVNEALVQLGDYYFEKNQFPQSETYFDKLIARKYVPLLPYAYYKKAWCAYNLGRQSQSVQYFKWVIENEEKANAETGAPIRIKAEALKDIALPFADLKMTDEAIQFYKTYGDPHYRRGLETMAALYYEAGEYKNAVLFNETLLAMDANYVKNPNYEISLIESLKMKHEDGAAVQRLFTRFPNYLQNSNWYEINASNPTAIKEAASNFEETAWKYATQYHAEAQRTKNNELYNLARKIYTRYLEFFPRTAKAPKARFQLPED
jgi:TolA-binding protein